VFGPLLRRLWDELSGEPTAVDYAL
jgi:hypothetical protein